MNRIFLYDNAKFWLVVLVILVHLLPGPDNNILLPYNNHFLQTLVILGYLFVMQCFVFIAGYFSKTFLTAEYIQKSFFQLLVPYVVVCIVGKFIASKNSLGFLLLDPPSVMWFLLALFVWRIIFVVAYQIRWPLLISLSVFAALVVGIDDRISTFLSLSRIFTFFPFFLLGHRYGDQLPKINFKYLSVLSVIIFLTVFGCIFYFPLHQFNVIQVQMSISYHDLGISNLEGVINRFLLMVLSSLLGLAFFFLIPKHKTYFSELGTRSIYAYIFHPLVILGLAAIGAYNNPPAWAQFFLLFLTFLTAVILSSKPAKKIFDYIIYPEVVKKIFIRSTKIQE